MKVLDKIKNNAFISGVLSIGLGNLIGQLIAVITVPILSRIYSVEAYGEYGITVSTSTIIISFATLGLMSAIMVPKEDRESNEVFTAAFWTQLLLTTLIILSAVVISPWYKLHMVSGSYILSLLIMWLYILGSNLNNILFVSINRKGYNKILFVNPIIGACGNLLIALPLGFLHTGYIGFFAAGIVSQIVMCTQMLMRYNPIILKYKPLTYFAILKKYKEYVLFQCPANLLETVSSQYPVQYFSRVFTSTFLGAYTMCVKLMQYPISLLAQPISTVYFRTATQYYRDGKNIAEFTYKMIFKIMLIAFLPIVVLILFGKPLFLFILGSKWKVAGELASILIYQYVLYFCSKCVSYCRVIIGRQKVNLAFNVLSLITTAMACFFGYSFFRDLKATIIVFSTSRCLIQIIDLSLNFYCMKKYTGKFVAFAAIYSLSILLVFAVS